MALFIMEKDLKDKRKKRNSKVLIGAFIFLSFIFGFAFGHLDFQRMSIGYSPQINKSNNGNPNFDVFWTVWDKITQEYDGKVDYQKMINGAIDGMVKSIGDPYSAYYTPEQTQNFQQELEGSISGIGAEIGIKDNRITIIAPIDNSPAQKAGIKAQDVVTKIDGVDTKDMDLNTAVSKIRGQEGTKVKLEISRGGQTFNYEITREKIDVKSVKWQVKDNNIGYISITRFDSNTANLIKDATSDLSSKNVRGIVLDLRNNPGGYLDAAVAVGSEFIQNGKIVIEKSGTSNKNEEYFASGKGKLTNTKVPMVVLVNGGSASASEIVAGAIQDSKRGILLGEKTFGKGSVQVVENIGNGASLHLTIAHWFTPNNRSISKEGLTPDIQVTLSEADANANKDPQLDRAIQEINSKVR